ncbi:FecR family protein [Chryseolinea sp. T2]|uniref:FecR family protein n=1 Tax=Chryseolinea sp. T2 TaxID=3129255 RepID=UPI0030786E00
MEKRPFDKILNKYLRGECTSREKALVEEWFASLDTMNDDPRLFDAGAEAGLQMKMLKEIRQRIARERRHQSDNTRRLWSPLRVAAAVLAVALAGFTWVSLKRNGSVLSFSYNGQSASQLITLQNKTAAVEEHRLPDGSLIKLQPHGTLIYARKFASDKREVRLIGEAFFDVTKDKTRPFIINARDVMVKVLGTSFNVIANEGDQEVKVAVRTGRVSVTRPVNYALRRGIDEVILTPNQEVTYNMVNENFSRQIVATPQIILPQPMRLHMKYEAEPVDEIFKVLEDNYGIDIVYDSSILSSCSLTTTMEDEGFYERIEIICQAIGATFEVEDARVLIKSAGCQELNN